MAVIDLALARLRDFGLEAFEGLVAGEPPGPYVVVNSDAGLATPHRLSIASHSAAVTLTALAVARTPEGCRDLASWVRAALTGARPAPGLPPLREIEASPMYVDGVEADRRYNLAVVYRIHTPTTQGVAP